ncbi:MAG: MFS transporter [Rubrivivax sp.]
MTPRTATVLGSAARLGCAQLLAWASAFYMPAILAAPMASSFGLATSDVFAMFSVALFVSGLMGPLAGRAIDRHGGRVVLMAANGAFATGLLMLAVAPAPWALALGWLVLGVAMGGGLYEAAFATLVRIHGTASRAGITGITLLGGFASTLGWSLSALMLSQVGWRSACVGWAVLHVVVGLPLHARLPRTVLRTGAGVAAVPPSPTAHAPVAIRASTAATEAASMAEPPLASPPRHALLLLSLAFSLHWFVTTAMAAHLPGVLLASGVTLAAAVTVAAVVGPSQVAGRLLDLGLLQRLSPLRVAQVAMLAHPLGVALLLGLGAAAALPFAVLHGAGNGVLTIVKGTLPLQLWGAAGYGARQGWLVMPGRLLQGLAPWLFGVALADFGARALWFSAALCVLSWIALSSLRLPPAARPGSSTAT